MSQKFPKICKLNNKFEFNSVFKGNLVFNNKNFIVHALKNELGISRLGISISKKNIKKAVLRNHFKRIIRECFRKNKDNFSGFDIVVNIRQSINDDKLFAKKLCSSFKELTNL